ncbi:MAG: kelch repeat-containing protein, partial [Thermoanaerobaculia bacterium]
MIIWGGGSYLNTGGRYNPTTNTWQPTSTGTNCPSGRTRHTAVWTEQVMIIWGGYNGSSYLNTGGRYNPTMNTWQTTTTFPAPVGRSDHTAVWTGQEMIIWGGTSGGIIYLNTGGKYNPTTDVWQVTSTGTNCPSERVYHTAVWTGQEMIVWGGYYYSGDQYLNTGGRYNPSNNSWLTISTGTNCPSGRA